MASQSLYRKWRSQTFSDLVGQEAIVRTLKNALTTGNPAHAYLFTGPRGTGKTSTARLLAKTINCLHPKDGEPCNACQQCREITSGNSFNVIEIDAASNRGIDSIRELREKVMMPPSVGKYKVYILDEAHMLTTEAFNALLKTLEEPPKHAIFVMATTDVHKMLPTVLSRCQRFDFKRITTRQIVAHLNYIAKEEQVKLEQGAAELIARAAAGGMRDALSLLDQAIAYAGQEIVLSQVQAMLGVADPRAIQKFITHVATLDSAGGLHLIHELAEDGADLRQINNQIAEYWRGLMLAKAGADVAIILDRTEDEVRELAEVTQLFELEELTECARVFAQNDLMQKNQGTPQLGLELALLTCIELHRRTQAGHATTTAPVQTIAAMQPRSTPTPVQPRPASVPEITSPVPPTVVGVQSIAPTAPVAPVVPVTHTDNQEAVLNEPPDWDDLSYKEDEEEFDITPAGATTNTLATPDEQGQPAASVTPVAGNSTALTLTVQDVKNSWEMVKRRVRTTKDGGKIAAILNGFTVVAVEGTNELPVIAIKASAEFHFKALQKGESYEAIEWALKLELERECHIKLLSPQSPVLITLPPVATPRNTNNHASNTTLAALQQSAYRERPATELPPKQREPEAYVQTQQPIQHPTKDLIPPAKQQFTEPLARTNVMRENRESTDTSSLPAKETHAPKETRIEVLQQKAKNDPVVQEVVRMFKAEIKEVRPK